MKRFPGRQVPCPGTFVNAVQVQHLRDYGTFSPVLSVSSFTIWRTLHEQGLHPYHLQRVQHLKSEDPPRRIAFCQWLLQ
jgi:hypothetical protein